MTAAGDQVRPPVGAEPVHEHGRDEHGRGELGRRPAAGAARSGTAASRRARPAAAPAPSPASRPSSLAPALETRSSAVSALAHQPASDQRERQRGDEQPAHGRLTPARLALRRSPAADGPAGVRGARRSAARRSRPPRQLEQLVLQAEHRRVLLGLGVVVAEQVQDAVRAQQLHLVRRRSCPAWRACSAATCGQSTTSPSRPGPGGSVASWSAWAPPGCGGRSSSMGKASTSVGPGSPIHRSCSSVIAGSSTSRTDSSASGCTPHARRARAWPARPARPRRPRRPDSLAISMLMPSSGLSCPAWRLPLAGAWSWSAARAAAAAGSGPPSACRRRTARRRRRCRPTSLCRTTSWLVSREK